MTYRDAGVDIEAGEEAVRLIKADVESTYIPGVLGSLGGFAGLFELPSGSARTRCWSPPPTAWAPRLLLAQETGRVNTVGIDLVAMSVNDVLTVGARPILFLDYVAVGRLQPGEMAQLVAGVAEGCRQAGCALVGGEMAEMPGSTRRGSSTWPASAWAWPSGRSSSTGRSVQEGDVVLGLASSGFHSNGYSLVRKVLEVNNVDLGEPLPGMSEPIADALLATHAHLRAERAATAGRGRPGRGPWPTSPAEA